MLAAFVAGATLGPLGMQGTAAVHASEQPSVNYSKLTWKPPYCSNPILRFIDLFTAQNC
jgi:hypothetical protein